MILKLHRPSGQLIACNTPSSKHGVTGAGNLWIIQDQSYYVFAHTLCGPFSRNRKTRAEALRKT